MRIRRPDWSRRRPRPRSVSRAETRSESRLRAIRGRARAALARGARPLRFLRPARVRPSRPVAILLLVALLAGVVWLLVGSTLFTVRRLAVSGADPAVAAEVRRVAQVRLGRPLALIDVRAVAHRVVGLPAVARVRVSQAFPTTLRIAVTQRVPVLALPNAPGASGYRLVDATGVVVATVPTPPVGLPVVQVATGPGAPTMAQALAVLGALPAPLLATVTAVQAPTPDSITLLLRGGRSIIWGSTAHPRAKVQILAVLLRQPGRIFDVSAAPTVVTARS